MINQGVTGNISIGPKNKQETPRNSNPIYNILFVDIICSSLCIRKLEKVYVTPMTRKKNPATVIENPN